MPVVRLRDVCHRYGSMLALDGISLDIPSGRVTGLIGPDGVGKSTLLGLIAGAKRLQDGGVEVLGGDMADAAHRRLICPRIALMPQGVGRNLDPELSVRENIDFFGRLFGQGQQTILVFNHASAPADASLAIHLPWPVKQARELENDAPLKFQQNAGRATFHKQLAAGEIWVFSARQ